jgi:hypothetical protein
MVVFVEYDSASIIDDLQTSKNIHTLCVKMPQRHYARRISNNLNTTRIPHSGRSQVPQAAQAQELLPLAKHDNKS